MFNPVVLYLYLHSNFYLSVADIANPDLLVCGCRTWISHPVLNCDIRESRSHGMHLIIYISGSNPSVYFMYILSLGVYVHIYIVKNNWVLGQIPPPPVPNTPRTYTHHPKIHYK